MMAKKHDLPSRAGYSTVRIYINVLIFMTRRSVAPGGVLTVGAAAVDPIVALRCAHGRCAFSCAASPTAL